MMPVNPSSFGRFASFHFPSSDLTEEEFMRFDEAVAPSGKTDEELWR